MRRIYYNNWLAKSLLWTKYTTAMLFGYICTKHKSNEPLSFRIKQHESIHAEQYWEIVLLSFLVALILQIVFGGGWWFAPVLVMYYILYFLEAIITIAIRAVKHGWREAIDMAYTNSMFEQEAKYGEGIVGYIEFRGFCSFLRYFGKI